MQTTAQTNSGHVDKPLAGPESSVQAKQHLASLVSNIKELGRCFDDLVDAVAQAVDKDLAYLDGEARGITHKDVIALRAALAKAKNI